MKKFPYSRAITWNSVLVTAVLLTAFVLPALPASWGRWPVGIGFNLIYLSGIMCLDKRKWSILTLAFFAFMLHWISGIFNWMIVSDISRGINMLFFIVVVFSLIRQMASARIVTARVILEAISGYVLLGIIFSVLISAILQQDPAAFNIPRPPASPDHPGFFMDESVYFSFVTLATLGYGDILPLKPYSRALSTFIAITGQLYIAIIIAMLVGKFAAGNHADER